MFADLFLHLSPMLWQEECQKLNNAIRKSNEVTSRSVNNFTPHECFVARAILIGSACFAEKGIQLWDDYSDTDSFSSISVPPNMSKYMKAHRFREYRKFIPTVMEDEALNDVGAPWWKFAS